MLSLIGSLFDQVSVRKYYDAIMAGVSFDFTLAQRYENLLTILFEEYYLMMIVEVFR